MTDCIYVFASDYYDAPGTILYVGDSFTQGMRKLADDPCQTFKIQVWSGGKLIEEFKK